MSNFRNGFLLFAIGTLLIPFSIYVKKFSQIPDPLKFMVSFNPMECYACRNCPCEYILDDNVKYKLNKADKVRCSVDYMQINKGIDKNLKIMTVEMNVQEYKDFHDCVQWYSQYPSIYKGGINE